MKPSQPIGDYLDALVHPSARQDVLTAARHRAFIAPRLVGSLLALAVLPVFLAVNGVPSVLEFIVLAWMVVPIATAGYLSRTGRYESAHVISALALTGIAITVAACSGGVNSFAAMWLVLIPLEAAVSGSRRVVAVAAMLALGGAVLLMLADPALGVFAAAARHAGALAALGIVSPLLYAIGIALGAERFARANSRLLVAQEDRWRLVAGNMTDVITRHGDSGRVLLASTNAYAVLGIAAAELQGLGLFDRVHIGDRPAFLTALSDASARGLAGSVEFRFRQPKLGDEAGRFAWIEMQCKPLDLPGRPNGEARDVVAVMRDVSKQKAQQQALVDARGEAERSNAAKSRFLAVMSHELRTPLNAVIGFSEMLANADHLPIDGERRQEYVRLINDAGCHLLDVVNDILDVSRLETGDLKIVAEPFKPAAVIEGCRELARPQGEGSGRHAPVQRAAGAAGRRRRQARREADIDQPRRQWAQVHQPRRHRDDRRRQSIATTSWCRSRTPASALRPSMSAGSAMRSSRCAGPMRAPMTAPASGFPSSRGW